MVNNLIFLVVSITISTFCLFSDVRASTLFAGVGNDGYVSDVQGLYNAMIQIPVFSSLSDKHIHSDLSGSDIRLSIKALAGDLAPGDTLIWFYSGHGRLVPDDSGGDETAPNAFSSDPHDEAIGLLHEYHGLIDDELSKAFISISSLGVHVIAIFDMCHAGGMIGGTEDLNSVQDLTLLASSMEIEQSYGYSDAPYSLFTQGLIDGLSAFMADSNGDDILTTKEWFDYAYDYTVNNVSNQHPVFWGDDVELASMASVPLCPSSLFLMLGVIVLKLCPGDRGLFEVVTKL